MIKFGKGNLRIPRFEKPVYVVAGGLTDYRKKYPEKNSSDIADALEKSGHSVSSRSVERVLSEFGISLSRRSANGLGGPP